MLALLLAIMLAIPYVAGAAPSAPTGGVVTPDTTTPAFPGAPTTGQATPDDTTPAFPEPPVLGLIRPPGPYNVLLISPILDSYYSVEVPWQVQARDSGTLASGQLIVDDVETGSPDTTATVDAEDGTLFYFGDTLDISEMASGDTPVLAVEVCNAEAICTTSQSVQITVDNTDPTVSITAPMAGVVTDDTTLSVDAADTHSAISSVDYYLDGTTLIATVNVSPFSITWDSTTVADATYTLTAVATDLAGNTATSAGVSIDVDQTPGTEPFVALHEAETMTLSGSFTEEADTAASGELYVGPTSGTNTTEPVQEASKVIGIVDAGTYYLWAHMMGPDGNSDALYLGIDGSWDRVIANSGSYGWAKVETTNGSGVFGFSLSAGNHTVQAGKGEVGTRLDAFWLTDDANATPPAIGTPPPSGEVLAFPTAEGFGRDAVGGRGGTVIKVTNLSQSGTGSFRACIAASGPRTCVFETSGTLNSESSSTSVADYIVTNPYLTIAAHTAPGNGFFMRGGRLNITTHNVVVRHLRLRPGWINPAPGNGWKAITAGDGSNLVIVDHCSIGWNTDDTMSFRGTNATFQWCAITQGLSTAGDCGSKYGKAGIANGGTNNVSFLHNFISGVRDRKLYYQRGSYQHINNVIYNGTGQTLQSALFAPIFGDHLNNYYKRGPDGISASGSNRITSLGYHPTSNPNVNPANVAASMTAVQGNYHDAMRPTGTEPETAILNRRYEEQYGLMPFQTTPIGIGAGNYTMTSAAQAYTDVLAKAGARVPVRDQSDIDSMTEAQNGTGPSNLCNFTEITHWGNWPSITQVCRNGSPSGGACPATGSYDTDNDGLPDAWETARGLNPNSAADGPAYHANGYTNLENYLNCLAGDTVPGFSC